MVSSAIRSYQQILESNQEQLQLPIMFGPIENTISQQLKRGNLFNYTGLFDLLAYTVGLLSYCCRVSIYTLYMFVYLYFRELLEKQVSIWLFQTVSCVSYFSSIPFSTLANYPLPNLTLSDPLFPSTFIWLCFLSLP